MSGEWISVEEKMPKEGQKVLMYGRDMYGRLRDCGRYWKSHWGTTFGVDPKITHWQPWPEDPE